MSARLLMAASVALLFTPSSLEAAPKSVDGKVVLANLDRYHVTLRMGKSRKDVQPKKASVLAPKKYPLELEYWSGNTRTGWKKLTIKEAGVYGLNYRRGQWQLAKLKSGKTPQQRVTARKPVARKSTGRQAKPRRQARTSIRPVVRRPLNADRRRWSSLTRAAWFAGSLYQFVRDEQDRDLLRHLLINGKLEDWKDFDRWLDGEKIAVPYKEELKDAFDSLAKLSDEDWKAIAEADDNDWATTREELGGLFSEDEWKNVTGDLADLGKEEFWQDDVDLNDLTDLNVAEELDLGEDVDLEADYDLADLDIDDANYDLGDYDDYGYEDTGWDGGGDFGGDDLGSGDLGGGDFGGDDFYGDDDYGDFGGFDDFDF